MHLHHEGLMIRVQCPLMICRGHIRPSMGALKFFLQLTVVCENLHFSQILHFFRWFKFTLKPPYSIALDNLRLAIWDVSFWTFWLKFGHKGP